MKPAKNPKDSVVSLWPGPVNHGEIIGSAFFIAPSLVLTARHNVRDNSDKLRENMTLGPMPGVIEKKINVDCIFCHPDEDIALIRLPDDVTGQPFSSVVLEQEPYEGSSVVGYIVDRDSGNQDQTSSYTISKSCDDGFLFDHRVGEGSSGGAVAKKQCSEVFGMVIKRHKREQKSLILPLYRIRKWLQELSQNDPEIKKFVNRCTADECSPDKSPTVANRDLDRLYRNFKALSIFIGRPQNAFKHVLDHLGHGNKGLKLCLCVSHLDKDDVPEDFSKALGLQLGGGQQENKSDNLLKRTEKDDFCVNSVKEVWNVRTYKEFRQGCIEEISEVLQCSLKQDDGYERALDLNELEQNVLTSLKCMPRPRVLIMKPVDSGSGGIFGSLFAPWRIRNQWNQRFAWLRQFNREWTQRVGKSDAQPLALLFFIKADRELTKRIEHCFRLDYIFPEDMENWRIYIERLLELSGIYPPGQALYKLKDIYEQLEDGLIEDQYPPYTYRAFKDQIEKVSQQYGQQQ